MCRKILLSHSSADKLYGDAIVSLLSDIGFTPAHIVYSSNPVYGIPIGKNIFDYLRDTIQNGVYVLYLLSGFYYTSVACMNEMGAAWVCQSKYLALTVPGFRFEDHRFQGGAADPRKLAVSLDDRVQMAQFAAQMAEFFGIAASAGQIENALEHYFSALEAIGKKMPDSVKKDTAVPGFDVLMQGGKLKACDLVDFGNSLWKQHANYPAAAQQYLYAIFQNEDYERAYVKLIETATLAGEYTDAWNASKEALKRFPKSGDVYGTLGYLEYNMGRYDDAAKHCTTAISLGNNRWFYNTRGRAYLKLQRYEEAASDFREALRLDPNYEPALQNLRKIESEKSEDER